MIKKILPLFLVIPLFFTLNSVWANTGLNNLNLPPRKNKIIELPPANNSNVVSLGTSIDPKSGKSVQGLAIIHYKGNQGKKDKNSLCYSFIANDAKWRSVEPWVVNPRNSRNLDEDFIFNNLKSDITKWEDAADGVVNEIEGYDILGEGFTTHVDLAPGISSPNGQNEVLFADISTPNAIAVTIVWGVFKGPPETREIIEWDMIFDDKDFNWSKNGDEGKMDFENIATHELGHSVGLNDLYNSCTDETMYGYSALGETKKRDLNPGDIKGVSELY